VPIAGRKGCYRQLSIAPKTGSEFILRQAQFPDAP
jgi:hypothetical protein